MGLIRFKEVDYESCEDVSIPRAQPQAWLLMWELAMQARACRLPPCSRPFSVTLTSLCLSVGINVSTCVGSSQCLSSLTHTYTIYIYADHTHICACTHTYICTHSHNTIAGKCFRCSIYISIFCTSVHINVYSVWLCSTLNEGFWFISCCKVLPVWHVVNA